MVNCSGSSTGAADVVVDLGAGGALGVGTATARGADPAGRAEGVSEGFGKCFVTSGVSFSSGVGFFAFFPLGVSFFLLAVFFFAAFAFAVGLGDFFGFVSSAVTSGVSLGFAFAEEVFFLCGDASPFGLGLGDSSDVSSGVFDGFGFGVGNVFFFALFFFGVGDLLGDGDGVTCAFTASARLGFSSSASCARRSVAMIALTATAVRNKTRKRTTAAQRNRAADAFKLAARPAPLTPELFSPGSRAGRLHSIFHPAK